MRYLIRLDVNEEMTPKEKSLLYAQVWRFVESNCIKPLALKIGKESDF